MGTLSVVDNRSVIFNLNSAEPRLPPGQPSVTSEYCILPNMVYQHWSWLGRIARALATPARSRAGWDAQP